MCTITCFIVCIVAGSELAKLVLMSWTTSHSLGITALSYPGITFSHHRKLKCLKLPSQSRGRHAPNQTRATCLSSWPVGMILISHVPACTEDGDVERIVTIVPTSATFSIGLKLVTNPAIQDAIVQASRLGLAFQEP